MLETPAAGPSSRRTFVSSAPAVNMDIRNLNGQRAQLNSLMPPRNNGASNGADDNSESSESTSGCSSFIAQAKRLLDDKLSCSKFFWLIYESKELLGVELTSLCKKFIGISLLN